VIDNNKIFDYLKAKIPNFKLINKRGQVLFTCPRNSLHKIQSDSPSMTPIPGSDKYYCLSCGIKISLYDMVNIVENKQMSQNEVNNFLNDTLKIDTYPELEHYKKYGWYLFPIAANSKVPLRDVHWKEENYNEKSKWIEIIDSGYNLAVACGKSNVMIVDFDAKEVSQESIALRDEIKKLLDDNDTLVQNSARGGSHYIFQIDEELCFKQKVDLGGLKIDTRTHKGYFIVSPSKYEGKTYNWVNLGHEIKTVSPELKVKLLSLMNYKKEEKSELPQEIIDNPIELVRNNLDGSCNDTFIRYAGVLLKIGIPSDKIKIALHYLNKHWLKNPMTDNAVDLMLGSIEGYKNTEESTQEKAIYDCCELVSSDISAKDIMEHTGFKRAIVDKVLAKFHKDGKLTRRGRGRYDLRAEIKWTDKGMIKNSNINFKIPYFNDTAYFMDSDLILIGAPTGRGKTTLAMNFIKKFKEQGIKPYYISLESGSRAAKVADKLGILSSDYFTTVEPIIKPTQISLVPNAVTIIDWLNLGEDFTATPVVFQHLSDEMRNKGGIMIVFSQLRDDFRWFAPDLVKQFARFSARYLYDDNEGIIGHFDCDKITDPKGHSQTAVIPCIFDFDTREVKLKNQL
jgi:hypothetical protein